MCDPPFVLPAEPEVSFPIIYEQQFLHSSQELTRLGKSFMTSVFSYIHSQK